MSSILPGNNAPDINTKYMNPDALRQLLRQERLRWHLKVNRDVDYYDTTRDARYMGEMINDGYLQRMEIRSFANAKTYGGYVGITSDIGNTDNKGYVHDLEKWDYGVTDEAKKVNVHRLTIGTMATIPDKKGYGRTDQGVMSTSTPNRMSMMLFDPYDGRAYLFTNDEPYYINNETSENRRPNRTIARLADIPTRITQLANDLSFVSDPGYVHTDNNYNHSNRFVLDNIDDRTFVYPEIAQDVNGEYINNLFTNIDGSKSYKNGNGYIPGIFASVALLESVDLINQRKPLRNSSYPDAKRDSNYYIMDGKWYAEWNHKNPAYEQFPLDPHDMETAQDGSQPTPLFAIDDGIVEEIERNKLPITVSKLHQWRYNRVEITYPSDRITITIEKRGAGYATGDILQWSFGDDVFSYQVDSVIDGAINSGHYIIQEGVVFNEDPSTGEVQVSFANTTGTGSGALFSINAKAKIDVITTQLKNNLYAYVNVGVNESLDLNSPWVDDAHTGINKGRGCAYPSELMETYPKDLKSHTGSSGAGMQVHLFRYVINTQDPTFTSIKGYPIFTGKWVDQGPLGIDRPQDIKALLLANPDTNNFNDYYKFSMDLMIDKMNRNPDAIESANSNTLSFAFFHKGSTDPKDDTRFIDKVINPVTNELTTRDVTSQVIYVNISTGVWFVYNGSDKADMEYGYPTTKKGWVPIAGVISK